MHMPTNIRIFCRLLFSTYLLIKTIATGNAMNKDTYLVYYSNSIFIGSISIRLSFALNVPNGTTIE